MPRGGSQVEQLLFMQEAEAAAEQQKTVESDWSAIRELQENLDRTRNLLSATLHATSESSATPSHATPAVVRPLSAATPGVSKGNLCQVTLSAERSHGKSWGRGLATSASPVDAAAEARDIMVAALDSPTHRSPHGTAAAIRCELARMVSRVERARRSGSDPGGKNDGRRVSRDSPIALGSDVRRRTSKALGDCSSSPCPSNKHESMPKKFNLKGAGGRVSSGDVPSVRPLRGGSSGSPGSVHASHSGSVPARRSRRHWQRLPAAVSTVRTPTGSSSGEGANTKGVARAENESVTRQPGMAHVRKEHAAADSDMLVCSQHGGYSLLPLHLHASSIR